MTGYNHYPSCTCGWCVNNGRFRLDPAQVRDQLRRRDALTFLERNSVTSISGCYINPNARCPVCSSPVYFYANQFGSRVYFDDLGPPWPKHPCTDNLHLRLKFHSKPDKSSSKRPLGLMQELVANANIIGIFQGKIFGTRNPNDWALLIITSVERRMDENVVKGEFLDSLKGETIEFRCFSSDPVFKIGDFISQKENEFSFVHTEKLIPLRFLYGSWISIPQEDNIPPKSVASPRRAKSVARPIKPGRLTKGDKRPKSQLRSRKEHTTS